MTASKHEGQLAQKLCQQDCGQESSRQSVSKKNKQNKTNTSFKPPCNKKKKKKKKKEKNEKSEILKPL